MTANVDALRQAFTRRFGRSPAVISEAPGRVNLIGEHTDYNEGFVLPVAIDRTVAVAGARGEAARIQAHSLDFDECDEFAPDDLAPAPDGGWRNYVCGVVWALRDAGRSLSGVNLTISGDVPPGAGLSSSAALEVAVAGAICAVSEIEIERRELALICQRAENEFVGVQCGIMDQLAAACSRAGHAFLIDCRSLEIQHLPLPSGSGIVVVDSGIPRRLDTTAYNERRKECEEAARLFGVRSLRDLTTIDLDAARPELNETLYRRARHVVTENARVLEAADSLRSGDIKTFGKLMHESHASLRDDFDVSTPELDLLVDLASQTERVLGARLTGAGFGGCTVNLVRDGEIQDFRSEVVERYQQETGLAAEMHVCKPAAGLSVRNG